VFVLGKYLFYLAIDMRNYTKIKYLSILSFLLYLTSSYGQSKVVFSNLTVKDGLSSHIVYAIESDNDDMTWAITANGIDRFDGKEFKHYNLIRQNNSIVSTLSINSGFFKDSKGVLWVYSKYGVFFYNEDLDKFEIFEYFKNEFEIEKSCIKINETDGKLLFFTWGYIVIWNRNNKKTKRLHIDFNTNTVCSFPSQGLLIGTQKGLKIFRNNKIDDFQLYGNSLKDANISSLYLHPNGTIWIGTRHKGMFIIRNNDISQLNSSGPYTIMDIMRYNGKVLVATDGEGIMVYNDNGKIIDKFNNAASRLYGFGLYDLHRDSKNRLWIASYGMGIFYYYPNKPVVFKFKEDLMKKIDANFGHKIYKDSDNRILLGTNKGMIVDVNSNNPKILTVSNFEDANVGDSNFVINDITEQNNGDYWISSFGHGMFLLDRNSLKVKRHITTLKVEGKEVPIKFILKFILSGDDIYIRLAKGELYRYNYKKNKSIKLPFNNVSLIKKDGINSGIFLATATSSYIYNNGKSVKLFDFQSTITDFISMSDSLFLMGTHSNGIIIYDYKNDSLYKSHYSKKLPNSIVQLIKENDKNFIFLAENKIFKAEVSPKKCKIINAAEIYDRFESIRGASIIIDNNLIIGGYDGFLGLPNYNNRNSVIKSKIIFDELEVEGEKITPETNSILHKRINKTKSLSLPYPFQDFRITLTSPNYLDKSIYYSWKLEGYDDEFNEIDNYKFISYNNLPSGNYTLKVRSYSTINGNRIDSKRIKIEILPPYWQTIWAYFVYSLLVLLLILATLKYFITARKQRNLKKRNQLFAEIAHEIRTPLTLINGPLQQLEEEEGLSDSAKRLLKGVGANLKRLNRRVSQLLDYERVQKVSDGLNISEFNLITFIDKLLVDFQPLLSQRNISIEKHIPIDEFTVTLDEDKLEKIFYNLISNAIKYSPDNSKIEIILNSNQNNWTFSVKDMGMGIPEKNQKNIFNRFYRADNAVKSGIVGSGIGLILSYKYAKLMNGDIVFDSTQNQGTSFTLTLPKYVEGEVSHIPKDVSHYGEEFTKLSDKKYDYRIAVAEDNEELRLFLKEALSENFKVDVFENGKECYEGLIENDYDLVLSDIMMPEMNGYELCDKIKGNIETSHLPIILLTALNASMYKAEGYEHGADHYVIKPFDIRMLKYRMISLIENRLAIKKIYQEQISTGTILEEAEPVKPSLDTLFLEKLEGLVLKNISDHEYGVQNICMDVGMSRPVLYRKLKALTDLSPKEYIQNKRLNLSKRLLEENQKTISSIAYESGYSDPKYFSTAFKKKYGISPSEYIKKNRNN
jgi:signal transduction histidine kinase/AraC-like DNA-binding protein